MRIKYLKTGKLFPNLISYSIDSAQRAESTITIEWQEDGITKKLTTELSNVDFIAEDVPSNDVFFRWHDVEEKPKFPCKVVMIFGDDSIDSGDYEDYRDWHHDVKDYGVILWCYWNELIPAQ